ncbi:MAG: hypothetical protein JW718_07640, partial [Desulfovibrionaceae bacterium]|nr:hypothetical protein [Desulfovibrionaceae bacterium]
MRDLTACDRLLADFGDPMTPQEVAKVLGVDVRTVKKYSELLGGVRVAPGRLRFFENRIRRVIDANADLASRQDPVARRGEDRGQDRRQ